MAWTMALAAVAAGAWGCSDFLAGWGARRFPVRTVLIGSKVTGLVLGLSFLVFAGFGADRRLLGVTAVAGIVGIPAMGLLYWAMRDGTLAVVAPVAAGAALVPVGWGLAHGEHLGAGGVVGAVAALAGITLVSWPAPRPRPALIGSPSVGGGVAVVERAPVRSEKSGRGAARWCAAGAAVGFGAYFVLLHEASAAEPYVATAYCRVFGGLAALVLALLWRGTGPAAGRVALGGRLAVPIAVGTLESLADGAFALAASVGALGAAAVLASLYPAVTVLLNTAILRERLPAVHLCGVLSALAGVACLAT
ncbi:EamA family transporter [Actinoplanes sp. HUAS TT8]|uniref:EamA family transporter n=1 Tax=Actinoplanes sp. HUAS TT8 TaxID=3447453 RepID=UPI003F526949